MANDEYISDENGHSDDEPTPQPNSKNKGEKTKQAVADDSRFTEGKLLAKGLEFGHRGSLTVAGGISVDLQFGTKIEPVDDKLDSKTGDTLTANDKSKQTNGAMLSNNHSTTLLVPTSTASDTKISTSCHKESVTSPAS